MKPSGIGGQAVLEGVMMRNKDKYAVAVRKADKEIVVDVKNCKNSENRAKLLKLPFIRGVVNFVDSLVIGIKTLTYSAEFYEEEEDVVEKPVDKVTRSIFKEKAESFLMGMTVLFSICFSVFLFIILPYSISELLKNQLNILSNSILAVVEGVVRIIIFILYLLLISRMKDIQRTFMYHGAEHKCINCIESGFALNVENAKMSSRIHKRCGTSFLFFVVFVSIVCFILISTLLPENVTIFTKVIVRLLLVPVIAGISYEILRLAGKSESKIMKVVSMPGMLMQKLTTKEPEDDMIEVAIEAVEAVFDWKQFIEDNKDDFGLVGSIEELPEQKQEEKKEEKQEENIEKADSDVMDKEIETEIITENTEKVKDEKKPAKEKKSKNPTKEKKSKSPSKEEQDKEEKTVENTAKENSIEEKQTDEKPVKENSIKEKIVKEKPVKEKLAKKKAVKKDDFSLHSVDRIEIDFDDFDDEIMEFKTRERNNKR